MLKVIGDFFGLITVDKVDSEFGALMAQYEQKRNIIRKDNMEQLRSLDVTKDGAKIQSILTKMNDEISLSYEKEMAVREFIGKIK